jgi:hypothetical protein
MAAAVKRQLARVAGIAATLAVVGGAPAGVADAQAAVAPAQLEISTSLDPTATHFGDQVRAVVMVEFDPRTVDGSSIRLVPSFIPYVAASPPVVTLVRAGMVRFEYALACVTDGCLPTHGPRILHLEPVKATGLAGGRAITATAPWPVLRISSRLVPADLTGRARFRTPATAPAPGYRISPLAAAVGMIAAAAICLLAVAVLLWTALRRKARRIPGDGLTPLELAIAYVRDSTRRSGADRRKALALLAESVPEGGDSPIGAAAARAAWSRPDPTAVGATELADRATGRPEGA